MDAPTTVGRDTRFRHARPNGGATGRPAAAVRSASPTGAMSFGRRSTREQADLDLLVTLILMVAVLLVLCVALGGVPSLG